jgi:3-hydroxybutyryl-CoA dehydrogenase
VTREFGRVGVIGLGTMGAGIVEVLARGGLDVLAVEADDRALERGREILRHSTDRAVQRGKLTSEDQAALLAHVRFSTAFEDLADRDLVLEAVPELLDLKQEIFGRLDSVVSAEAVLATNTSSLSVTEIAVATHDPSRVVGMHFFNPAPVLRLVEVIRTVVTEESVVDDVRALAARLGKRPVVVSDRAGFIANALLFGYLNHAVAMVESGYASREDIDAAMTLGAGLPMGPLALLDLIGLDTAHEILETMYAQSRDRLHAPRPVLRQMSTAGLRGRKSGRGFYTYDAAGSGRVVEDALTPRPAAVQGVSPRPVQSVGIAGSGPTASGLAEAFARSGFEVTVVTGSAEDRSDADLVVAAVGDEPDAARALFERLDQICRPGAVLATTTSSLPVVECAVSTRRPEDVVGLHLVDRGVEGQLVEVVHTVSTAPDVVATAMDVVGRLGRRAVSCGDRSGFVVDALLFPYLNDAVRMLEAGYAGVEDIDTAMTSGCGYPMGPFELLDTIGLDVALAVQRRLYLESGEPGFAPAPLLEQLVTAGHLGRRTGRGFRTYG